MPVRVQLALAVAVAFLLAGAIALLATGGRDRASSAAPNAFAGALRPPGLHAPRAALRDQDARPVRLGRATGRVTIVSFLYTTCRDTCPITAQQIRGALDDLGPRARVDDVAVSVDPANDTPALARRFLARQSLTGRMRFALGTRTELAPVWRGFGIRPQSGREEHSGYVVLVDGAGRQRIGFPADKVTPEDLAHDAARLARER